MVTPIANLLADVQQQAEGGIARILEPHTTRPLPHVQATVVLEAESHGFVPNTIRGTGNDRLGKTRRHRGRSKFTQARRAQARYDYDN